MGYTNDDVDPETGVSLRSASVKRSDSQRSCTHAYSHGRVCRYRHVHVRARVLLRNLHLEERYAYADPQFRWVTSRTIRSRMNLPVLCALPLPILN